MSVPSRLEALVATFPSVMVGYSGGVDSSLLAVVTHRMLGRGRAVAALGISASLSVVQRQQAIEIADRFDLELLEVVTDEMQDARYVANPTNRCYFCKRELWDKLRVVASARGIAVLADGTNADDLGGHRPGLAAAAERAVRSPLAEAGYSKSDVRAEARRLGLPNWDAPAAPCLSSRLRYGLAVTPERLHQVEAGEALLRSVGIAGDLRVRHRGAEARIEVAPTEFRRVRGNRADIAEGLLALGFDRVTLDLQGYRSGSLLRRDEEPGGFELLAERP